jgi:dTMP kinase
MPPAASPGFLLVLEGIDGMGKSTVARALVEYCRERDRPAIFSREPTDGPWGRKLRQSAQSGRLSLEEELECFLADRAEHVAQIIQPGLAAGKVVILDRYYLSTAAYQGARGADPEKILAENERFAPPPDLALLLDAPPSTGLGRVQRRGDVPDEFEHASALAEVRRIFLAIGRPWIVRIDAALPAAEVAGECIAQFEQAWSRRGSRVEGRG